MDDISHYFSKINNVIIYRIANSFLDPKEPLTPIGEPLRKESPTGEVTVNWELTFVWRLAGCSANSCREEMSAEVIAGKSQM